MGCIKSRGVKYMPSFDRRVRFTVLAEGICLLDVFESTKDLVTVKRAALFKERSYGLSNLKRIRRHPVQLFFFSRSEAT